MKHTFKFLIIALTALVVGCAAGVTAKRPDQIVYAAHGNYVAALNVAIQYKRLPTCGPGVTPLCKEPATVKKIQDADDAAYKALSTAQAAVRAGDGTGGAAEASAAQKAIAEFKKQTAALPKGNP